MNPIIQKLEQQVMDKPDHIALVGNNQTLSYAELYQQVQALARAFNTQAIQHIGLWLDNGPQSVVVQLAALQAGVCVTPVPLFFSPPQQSLLFASSPMQLLFASPQLATGPACHFITDSLTLTADQP